MTRFAFASLLLAAMAGPLGGCSAIVDVDDFEIDDGVTDEGEFVDMLVGQGQVTVGKVDGGQAQVEGGQFNTGCYESSSEEDPGLEYIYTFTADGEVALDMIAFDSTCAFPIFVQTFRGSYTYRGDVTGGVAIDMIVARREMKFVDPEGAALANEIELLGYKDWALNQWVDLLGVVDDAGNKLKVGDKLFILTDFSDADEANISLPAVGAVPLDTYEETFYRTEGDEGVDDRFP